MIGFLRGELGDPPGGWPEPFRSRALEGRRPAEPSAELTDDDLRGLAEAPRATLNRLLFPAPTREFEAHRDQYGDTSVLPTKDFLYGLRQGTEHAVDLEPGVRLLIGIEAISDPDERGMRTVMCTLNGQLRPVSVRDRSIDAHVKAAEKADRSDPGQVAAPFAGVVTLKVAEGDTVSAGQPRRHDRGHEDGSRHHRARGRDGAAAGHRRGAAGRGRGPACRPALGRPASR